MDSRFKIGSRHDNAKRLVSEEWFPNWIGNTWMSMFNRKKLPSINQIERGLIDEAKF